MMDRRPVAVTIRAYNVGFGDCFLLTFHYEHMQRNVLIDFGSTAHPRDATGDLLHRVSEDIRRQSEGKLHAVVATHRHRDHISGFAGPSGRIIAALQPEVVVQPWTEDPAMAADAVAPLPGGGQGHALRDFVSSLRNMELVAHQALLAARANDWAYGVTQQLETLGELNLPNEEAIANLSKMGRFHRFVYYGAPDPLKRVLPGVRTRVLGPPTLIQSEAIRHSRSRDENEFWHLQAHAMSVTSPGRRTVFPRASVYTERQVPPDARLFIEQLQKGRGDQLLAIVRALDAAINNTSIILLFEVGSKKLLFSGDAQIENWSVALSRARDHLKSVDVYKVGHHGSLNATPKTLWQLFNKRRRRRTGRQLTTLLSTLRHTHGNEFQGTEVPRKTLVEQLQRESRLHRTDVVRAGSTVRVKMMV